MAASDDEDYGPVAPSPTRTAIAILRARFPGLQPNQSAEDAPEAYGYDPTGSIALKMMRDTRLGELSERLVNDEAAAAIPHEGYVLGEPGRRIRSNASDVFNARRTRGLLENLGAEAAADPYTGEAEQARTQAARDVADKASLTMRPDVGAAAEMDAQRNAFAAYMKQKGLKMGEYEAGASPAALEAAKTKYNAESSDVAQHVLDEASKREIQKAEAMKGALFGDLGQGTPNAPAQKYTAQEQKLKDDIGTFEDFGPKAMAALEQDNPNIATAPGEYGSWTDVLGQAIGGRLYRMGKSSSSNRDQIDQFVGFLEATIPRMLASGRLNQQQYEDLKAHAPQLGLSDGANYERIRNIMRDIMPSLKVGIAKGNSPDQLAPASPGTSAPASPTFNRATLRDPNWGK